MILRAFGDSDIGKVRARNEDSYIARPEVGLFAVADGMGGHVAGHVASRTALDVLTQALPNGPLSEESLLRAVQAANLAVWQLGEAEPDKAGMGTTMTVLAFTPDVSSCVIGHVGDSRAYRLRAGTLEQLTHDHTAAQQLVDSRQLSREAARRHPLASMLQRSIGTRPHVDVDLHHSAVVSGDRYLLCSDGLSGMMGDADLTAILARELPLEAIVGQLIETANLRGGPDNITAILVSIS